ncbi:MAG: competence/damage-inducible protein A [Syntrophobacterales bacterium]|nr:competence/damage-inducible protein A [Syntrophobacterales bacterium]
MREAKRIRPVVVTIGNEIIFGERMDDNRLWMLGELKARDMPAEATLSLPDDENVIGHWVSFLSSNHYTPVFLSGGIGGTHDDRTRQGVAIGLNKPLVIHNECFQILKSRYGSKFTEQRQRMAWLPEGSSLIPNPLGAPGFMINDIFCFPGFPEMLRPMFLWVLEKILGKSAPTSKIVVKEWYLAVNEGEVAEAIERFATQYPEASIGLYPHIIEGKKQHVTVRLRYPYNRVDILNNLDSLISSMGWKILSRTYQPRDGEVQS